MRCTLLLFAVLSIVRVHATHTLGGELFLDAQSGLTYTVTLHIYVDPSSPADRPEMPVDLGDGMVDTLPRVSITPLAGAVCETELHVYTGSHTYAGPGTYLVTVSDPNRTNGILNIPDPTSVAFCLRSLLVIDPLMGVNSTARFTALQTEATFNFSTLVHDPVAVDPDGDSLSFELVEPLGTSCLSIPGYATADQVVPGTPLFWIDPTTGTLLWDHPQLIGRYNVVIRCSEWRNGQLVGQVTRDMTLCVGQVPTAMAEAAPAAAPSVRTLDTEGLYQVAPPGTAVRSVHDAQGRVLPADLRTPGLVDLSGRPAGLYLVQVQAPSGTPRMIRVLRP